MLTGQSFRKTLKKNIKIGTLFATRGISHTGMTFSATARCVHEDSYTLYIITRCQRAKERDMHIDTFAPFPPRNGEGIFRVVKIICIPFR